MLSASDNAKQTSMLSIIYDGIVAAANMSAARVHALRLMEKSSIVNLTALIACSNFLKDFFYFVQYLFITREQYKLQILDRFLSVNGTTAPVNG